MAINVSVQYNDGFLPDIILLTQGYIAVGRFNGPHLSWSVRSLGFPLA